jgi:hypothetical protein
MIFKKFIDINGREQESKLANEPTLLQELNRNLGIDSNRKTKTIEFSEQVRLPFNDASGKLAETNKNLPLIKTESTKNLNDAKTGLKAKSEKFVGVKFRN